MFALPRLASAQTQKKNARIGFLSPQSPVTLGSRLTAFHEGLRGFGYTEGKNLHVDYRYAQGKVELFPALAAELVRLNPDCIAAAGADAVGALTRLTKTIPIVILNIDADPVEEGFVASLARPGGNVTGLTGIQWELAGKRLELLLEIVPRVSRIAVLFDPRSRASRPHVDGTQAAVRKLGKQLQLLEARDPDGIDAAFKAARDGRADAISAIHVGLIQNHRARITNLALKAGLPGVYSDINFVSEGGLIAYAPDTVDQYRRAGVFVDKILKGAKPADLPIEQPTKFELVLNMKTAKTLGITFPQTILMRADRVIE